jgi:hypothetical protein
LQPYTLLKCELLIERKEALMKQHKKVKKQKTSRAKKPRRLAAKSYPSASIINQDEMMHQINIIAKALIDASNDELMADLQSDEELDWENDGDWLKHLERSVERLEHKFSVFNAISIEDIHEGWKRFQEENPEYEAFPEALPVEHFIEQFVSTIRNKFQKALFFARIERDAELLRMTIREEVYSLGVQNTVQVHDFIKLPPLLPQEDMPELSEKERAEITEIYCRKIWWMMADDYPEDSTTHFYLECPEGWFSAEVYSSEEEAEQEVEKRRQKGEGDFEIREITEGDDWVVFTVLFSKRRPNFIG